MTKIYALIGSTENVNKSWSPTIHNAWFKHYKIDAEYIGFGHDGNYRDIIEALKKRKDVYGINLTTPFKGYERGDNVIKDFQSICYYTENTDGYGFTKAFEPYLHTARQAKDVIVLGDGCVARTIKDKLKKSGINAVMFSRATIMAIEICGGVFDVDSFVINATTGLKGSRYDTTVNYDRSTPVEYFPVQMLIHQAAKSFEIWHGFLPDIKIAEHAIIEDQKKLTNQP